MPIQNILFVCHPLCMVNQNTSGLAFAYFLLYFSESFRQCQLSQRDKASENESGWGSLVKDE